MGRWLFFDRTPIHAAIFGGHTDILQVLVDKGADFNLCDFQLKTPLMYAASCGKTAALGTSTFLSRDSAICSSINEILIITFVNPHVVHQHFKK